MNIRKITFAKYTKKLLIIMVLVGSQLTNVFYDTIVHAWSYPVKQVSTPECKGQLRKDLPEECKVDLPKITNAQYTIFSTNQLYRQIYSVLRGAPYSDGRNMAIGAHEGIDIVSAKGTPVYAAYRGKVIRAGAAAGYGNLITIQHSLSNDQTVYTIYGHLDTVNINVGDTVEEGQFIGTIGSEGMSTGDHLHFAINITKNNTYVFSGCLNYPQTSDRTIVQQGLCRDFLQERTVDPIAFIEFDGTIPNIPVLVTTRTINRRILRSGRRMVPIAPVTSNSTSQPTNTQNATTQNTNQTQRPSQTTTSNNTAGTAATAQLIKDPFLQTHTITVQPNFGSSLSVGQSNSISISIESKDGKVFTGVLDKELIIVPSKNNVRLTPRVIRHISGGKIVSIIEGLEAGESQLVISYGSTIISTISVTVR